MSWRFLISAVPSEMGLFRALVIDARGKASGRGTASHQAPGKAEPYSRRKKIKKLIMCIAGCIALAPGLAVAATFTGEVMDEACADDGGHQAMFKKMGTNDPKQCTLACVKGGSKYVLYESGKTYYKLDDQKKPEAFAGQKVQVTGSLNKSTKTIHVTEIKSAS